MDVLIVTGMSGAGKSQAANVLEDIGFYCVDNIPPAIIPSFIDLSQRGNAELGRLAIVTDVRGGNLFTKIIDVLQNLKNNNVDYKILFLDAADDVLIKRYKENRRKHPLCDGNENTIIDAVNEERQMLSKLRFMADYTIDTSSISLAQLKSRISEIFLDNKSSGMKIVCKSFGFKYGSDTEADFVVDLRCLPNPFYIDELKYKTGLDKEVNDYIFKFDESNEFAKKLLDFLDFTVPLYIKEGKSQLVLAFGCTGGKHRSVTFAQMVFMHLRKKDYMVTVSHRDIHKA